MAKTSSPACPHDYGFEVPPRSRRELTQDAHAIHTHVGYRGHGPFPIVRFVERVLPVVYDGFELVVESEDAMGGRFGLTYPDKRLIVLREDIYDTAVEGKPFARMTVAHEVGHLLEHCGIPVAMACRPADAELSPYRNSEWQANAFAGALLMPACRIVGMQTQAVASVYGVTQAAADVQTSAMCREARSWSLPQL